MIKLNKKMKEFQNLNPILKDNFLNHKFQPKKRIFNQENNNSLENKSKKNLPELKLTKLKMRPVSDPETDWYGQRTIGIKTGLKFRHLIPNSQKNHVLSKKPEKNTL